MFENLRKRRKRSTKYTYDESDSDSEYQEERIIRKTVKKETSTSLVGVNSLNSDIDEILGINEDSILIKKKELSYLKAEWVLKTEIPNFDSIFLQDLRDKPPYFNSLFIIPELAIPKMDYFAVKWKGLGYQFLTKEESPEFAKIALTPKRAIKYCKIEPYSFFNIPQNYRNPIKELVDCFQSQFEHKSDREFSLVGGVGSLMRKQLYSLIHHVWENISSLPVLFIVEQRMISVIEAELFYTIKPNVLIVSADDADFTAIKNNCFNPFLYDMILVSVEMLGKVKKELNEIKFSIAAIDMTEISGRKFDRISNASFFGKNKFNAIMKLGLVPFFISNEFRIDSGIYPTLEEFTWILTALPEAEIVHNSFINENAMTIFGKKEAGEVHEINREIRKILDFHTTGTYKDVLKDLMTACSQFSRKRLMRKIQKKIFSYNTKLASVIQIIKHCMENNFNVLVFTSCTECITVLEKYNEASRWKTFITPYFERSFEEIASFLDISNEEPSVVIACPDGNTVDLHDLNFRYVVIHDPEYHPHFITSGKEKTTIVRLVTQGTLEVPLCGSNEELSPIELNDYAKRFYWRPKKERSQIDYSGDNFLCFENSYPVKFSYEPGSIGEDYEIHSTPTDFKISVIEMPNGTEAVQIYPTKIKAEDVKTVFDNLSIYCWGQWDRLCSSCSEACSKTYAIAIISILLSRRIIFLPLLDNFINNERLPISAQAYKEIASTVTHLLTTDKETRIKLKRIEKLLLIAFVVQNSSDPPKGINLQWTDLEKPSEWWNIDDDKMLIWRCWLHGYMKICNMEMSKWSVEERVDEKDLAKRLRIITAVIRKNIESYTPTVTWKPLRIKKVQRSEKVWSSKEQNAIISQLLSYGSVDEEQLSNFPQLSKRKPDEIREFTERIIRASETTENDPELFCSRKCLDMIKSVRNLFDIANQCPIDDLYVEDRVIVETVLSYGLSKACDAPCLSEHPYNPTKATIKDMFEQIVLFPDVPKEDLCEGYPVTLPLTAGKDILVTSLGKVHPKKGFSSYKYVYPVGLMTTVSFCNNPASCEICEQRGNLVFVVRDDIKHEEYVGETPTEAWQAFIKAVLPLESVFYQRISGDEFFGLRSPNVLYAIQLMKDSIKCRYYKRKFFKGNEISLGMRSAVVMKSETQLEIESDQEEVREEKPIKEETLPAESLENILKTMKFDDLIPPTAVLK